MLEVEARQSRRARREFGALTVNLFAVMLLVITACVAASLVLLVVKLGQLVLGG